MSSGSVLPDEGVVGVYLHQGYDVEIHDSLAHCSKSFFNVPKNSDFILAKHKNYHVAGKVFRFGKFLVKITKLKSYQFILLHCQI